MPYITPGDLVLRYDRRRVAELLSDNDASPVDPLALPGNVSLLAIINDACGEVNASVTVGNKYTIDNLNELTGADQSFLKRLVSNLVWGKLLLFKGLGNADIAKQAPGYTEAQKILAELSNGSMVFGTQANRDAGLPAFAIPDRKLTNSPSLWNRMFGTFGYNCYGRN